MLKPNALLFLTFAAFLFAIFSCEEYTPEQKLVLTKGKEVYLTHCISCHGPQGDGLQGAYPSLLKPEITASVTQRAVGLVLNGSPTDQGMKPVPVTNEELVQVINYIQNSWGNKAPFIEKEYIPKNI